MIDRTPIVDWSEFDTEKILVDRTAVEKLNPHRYEMSLIDGIVFEDYDSNRCVGVCKVQHDAFWSRGHFPGRPLMPGVLICELAAQICSYYSLTILPPDKQRLIVLGSFEEIRFRAPVVPGKTLVMMVQSLRMRPQLTKIRFQGWVDRELAADGILTGFAISK